jgi:hypothetical protein
VRDLLIVICLLCFMSVRVLVILMLFIRIFDSGHYVVVFCAFTTVFSIFAYFSI